MNSFVVVKVNDSHFLSDILKLLEKVWHSIIIKNYDVKLFQYFFFVFFQYFDFFLRQNLLKSLSYLTLNPNGNVFFNEVFNHGKVISMVLCFFLHWIYLIFNFLKMFLCLLLILLVKIKISNQLFMLL